MVECFLVCVVVFVMVVGCIELWYVDVIVFVYVCDVCVDCCDDFYVFMVWDEW